MTREEVVERVRVKIGEIGNRPAPPTLPLHIEAVVHVFCELGDIPFSNINTADGERPDQPEPPQVEA